MRKKKGKKQQESTRLEKRAVPKSELDMDTELNVTLSTIANFHSSPIEIQPSNSFQQTPAKDQAKLFTEKCQQCSIICDFSRPDLDVKSKKVKTQLLKDLILGFQSPFLLRALTSEHYDTFYLMLSKNLFRPFPELHLRSTGQDFHDLFMDSAWPHLQLFYEVLNSSIHVQTNSTISPIFIYKLIFNCGSLDSRERIAARDTLHAIYTKYMNLREIIRQKIAEHFIDHFCSSELLDFLISIVVGFNSPLKPDHVSYYLKYILPLHCLPNYQNFSNQLTQCTIVYIQKSGPLFEPTIRYILNHWPHCSRIKEKLFLKELEEFLLTFQFQIPPQSLVPIFKQIASMAKDSSVEIVETVYDIMLQKKLQSLLKSNSSLLFPIIVPAIKETQNFHWDEIVRYNSVAIIQYLSEVDHQTLIKVDEENKIPNKDQGESQMNWTKISDSTKLPLSKKGLLV